MKQEFAILILISSLLIIWLIVLSVVYCTRRRKKKIYRHFEDFRQIKCKNNDKYHNYRQLPVSSPDTSTCSSIEIA